VTKGKAPAFQFYVRDWLSDPELQSCPASTRGIWINCLCFMWESQGRGKLTGKKDYLARMLNATAAEFDQFLKDASVTKFANVTICNSDVTIENRRMSREEKEKKNTRMRVRRHRESKPCNADVTPPSSSSSSSSCTKVHLKDQKKPPSGGDHFQEKVGGHFDEIKTSCDLISTLPQNGKPFNPFQFVQRNVNAKKHPGAIAYVLKGMINNWPGIKDKWAYANKAIISTSQNFNEKEAVRIHQEMKTWQPEQFEELTKGVLRDV
jgi:hypothetical protein